MLSEEKLNHFKEKLLQLRKEAEEEIQRVEESYKLDEEMPDDSIGKTTNYDNHPGDLGTEMHERTKAATIADQARIRIGEIDHALEKIENGTYGVSEKSGKPIPEERLEVQPYARNLVEEAEADDHL